MVISRSHVADLAAQAVVVISKNANVATGTEGTRNAEEITRGVAARLGLNEQDVLIASTGVIGRQYPIENIRAGIAGLPSPLPDNDAEEVARAQKYGDVAGKLHTAMHEVIGHASGQLEDGATPSSN